MDIRSLYAVRYKNISKTDEGSIIKMRKSSAILKRVDLNQWEVTSTACILDYLKKNGFKNIISIFKARDGKPYAVEKNRVYVLMDYVDGEKVRLRTTEEGVAAARLLGEFHNAGRKFIQPSGTRVRVLWGKTMERYRLITSKMEKYKDYLSSTSKLNDFDKCAAEAIDDFILRAKSSMKVLRSEGYFNALEKSMKEREICINDISSSTLRLDRGRMVICKIFNIGYNMVEEDIAELIKRIIEQTGDREAAKNIIEEYRTVGELDENSELIIRALVSYPYDSLKIASRYFVDMEKSEEFLEKFKKYVEVDKKTDVLGV